MLHELFFGYLGDRVGGRPGVCTTATFKKKKQLKIHVSSPTNTEQFFSFKLFGVSLIIFFIICFSLP